ncbi:MAG TPA: hypothetical protein VGE74_26055 [Gemmata sp.]
MRVLVCASVLLVAAGCGRVTNSTSPGPDAPAEAKGIPNDWNHRDLLAHLNKKGLRLRMIPTNRGAAFAVPVFFVPEDSPIKTEDEALAAHEAKKPGIVLCVLFKTAQQAKDEVGASESGFANGRFGFSARSPLREQLQAALP